ncbi:MAG: hypothetical protein FJW26_00810 [Acidimicrobiia bacterium]|nr:hypothetical protein [Acidimicrobiia bacterium]
MTADSDTFAESPLHTRMVLAVLLVATALNLLYPGEVFFQSRYLFVLSSVATCAIVLYRDARKGISTVMLRQLGLLSLPLASMVPSLIWTTNRDRSQEVLLLFFAYSCLLFTIRRCRFNSMQILVSAAALVATGMLVEGHAIYQHFVGLDALGAELRKHPAMSADFREALLARVESGRIFANFALPNTLAGLVTMVLPLQVGLLAAGFFPSRPPQGTRCLISVLTNGWFRLALIAGIPLSLWVLMVTQSFGGWVGFSTSLATVVFVGWSKTRRGTHRILWGCILLALAGTSLVWVSQKRGFHLWNLNASENPIALRAISHRTALAMFRDFPVVGVGPGNYGTMNARYQTSPRFVTQFAHNTPLQLLAEGGLVLWTGFSLAVWITLRRKQTRHTHWRQTIAGDPLYLGMWEALAAWLAHNAVDIDLYFPSLGALGFFLTGLVSNYFQAEADERHEVAPWQAKTAAAVATIVLGAALITGVRFQLSHSFFDLARAAAASGSAADASWYARWGVKLQPGNAAGVVFLGKLEAQQLKQSGQPAVLLLEKLRQSLCQAVDLDPHNAEFHFELSRVYRGLGHEDLSQGSLARAVALFPSEARYRLVRPADSERTNTEALR